LNRLLWSASAVADLRDIRAYIAEFNPAAAARLAASLIEACENLRNFPHRGRTIAGGLREWPLVHPSVIRYQISGEHLHILRIRHGKRA
jgi:plasmid stabilization system protein ParE